MGELSLLPAVRQAPPDALIVADGTSCRHQIGDGTGREALHVARVLAQSVAAASAAMERIRRQVARMTPVTISVGISELAAKDADEDEYVSQRRPESRAEYGASPARAPRRNGPPSCTGERPLAN